MAFFTSGVEYTYQVYIGQPLVVFREIMDVKRLGKRIKLARVERDLTQEELAKKIAGLQKTISLYETGQAAPTLEALIKIAKALKKPPAHFLEEA